MDLPVAGGVTQSCVIPGDAKSVGKGIHLTTQPMDPLSRPCGPPGMTPGGASSRQLHHRFDIAKPRQACFVAEMLDLEG